MDHTKNVGSSSRKHPFRMERNLSICLTPTEIQLLITFEVKRVVNAGPAGRDLGTCLKSLNWAGVT